MSMFKKISSVLLILILVGCTNTQNPSEKEFNDNIEVAQYFMNQFKEGDMTSVVEVCSEELLNDLSIDDFENLRSELSLDSDTQAMVEDYRDYGKDYILGRYIMGNEEFRISLRFDENNKLLPFQIGYWETTDALVNDEIEEIDIQTGVDGTLSGRLTLPKGSENPPVILLIHGSGPSNMNEKAYALSPFEDIAQGLAQQGIASIRYDKRTYSFPLWEEPADLSLQWEYFNDIEAILDQVESLPVNSEEIYLLGHSLGGMLVPKIAYENDFVAGIISLASTPQSLEDVIYDQNIFSLVESGYDENQIEFILKDLDQEIEKIKNLQENSEDEIIITFPSSYWYELNQSYMDLYVDKLDVDFLVLNGGKDFQVIEDNAMPIWRALLEGYENHQIKVYPELNHMMTESEVMSIEDYQTEKSVSKEVIDDIASWIKEREIVGGK